VCVCVCVCVCVYCTVTATSLNRISLIYRLSEVGKHLIRSHFHTSWFRVVWLAVFSSWPSHSWQPAVRRFASITAEKRIASTFRVECIGIIFRRIFCPAQPDHKVPWIRKPQYKLHCSREIKFHKPNVIRGFYSVTVVPRSRIWTYSTSATN